MGNGESEFQKWAREAKAVIGQVGSSSASKSPGKGYITKQNRFAGFMGDSDASEEGKPLPRTKTKSKHKKKGNSSSTQVVAASQSPAAGKSQIVDRSAGLHLAKASAMASSGD